MLLQSVRSHHIRLNEYLTRANSMTDEVFREMSCGVDLKLAKNDSLNFSEGCDHVCRENAVFPVDGLSARGDIQLIRCALRWGTVQSRGICPTDLPGELPHTIALGVLQRPGNRQDARFSHRSDNLVGSDCLHALQKPLASRVVFQMDQATSSDQVVLRCVGKCGQDANLECSIGLSASRHCSKKVES